MAPGRSSRRREGEPRLDPDRDYKRPKHERSLAKLPDRGEKTDPLRKSRRGVQIPAGERPPPDTPTSTATPTPTPDPLSHRLTPVPDAYSGPNQSRDTYLTTYELADELEVYVEQVQRWCRAWFGQLPVARQQKGEGYRIPLEYRYVARCWRQLQDRDAREAARNRLIVEPRDWLVVVARTASSHYTSAEAMRRVESLTRIAEQFRKPIHVLYVGGQTQGS